MIPRRYRDIMLVLVLVLGLLPPDIFSPCEKYLFYLSMVIWCFPLYVANFNPMDVPLSPSYVYFNVMLLKSKY